MAKLFERYLAEQTCPQCRRQYAPRRATQIYCSRECFTTSRRGAVHTPEAKAKQRAAKLGIRGAAHWNWRGGKRSERKRAMVRDEYVQWRKAVFERDRYTCVNCGLVGVKLHADHIRSWSAHPEGRYDVANGRTLCVPCHWATPTFPRKLIPREHRA